MHFRGNAAKIWYANAIYCEEAAASSTRTATIQRSLLGRQQPKHQHQHQQQQQQLSQSWLSLLDDDERNESLQVSDDRTA